MKPVSLAPALSLALAFVSQGVLHAQSVTGQGYIYLTQPSTSWTPPNNVTNTPRFIWYPDKAAVRFGDLTDSYSAANWNSSQVGEGSFAGGVNALASGYGAFAFNGSATGMFSSALGPCYALGNGSFAAGWTSSAAGDYSIAIGFFSGAEGDGAIAMGGDSAWALGDNSIALGVYSVADGENAVAIGSWSSTASGVFSTALHGTALGAWSLASSGGTATGSFAVAIGGEAVANSSVAIGYTTLSTSSSGVALGVGNLSKRRNGDAPNPTTPAPDDPLLMLGNSTAISIETDSDRSNALTVYRDGQAHFKGAVRVPQSGDISMGGFTAVPAGVVFP